MAVATALRKLFSPEVSKLKAWLDDRLHEDTRAAVLLQEVEAKTGLPRLYGLYVVWAVVVVWLIYGPASGLLCNVIVFVYPACKSMQALSSYSDSPEEPGINRWLIYWLIFSTLALFEYFSSFIHHWLPFYWLSKCVAMIWCMAPMKANGSVVMHRLVKECYQDTRDLLKSQTNQQVKHQQVKLE